MMTPGIMLPMFLLFVLVVHKLRKQFKYFVFSQTPFQSYFQPFNRCKKITKFAFTLKSTFNSPNFPPRAENPFIFLRGREAASEDLISGRFFFLVFRGKWASKEFFGWFFEKKRRRKTSCSCYSTLARACGN